MRRPGDEFYAPKRISTTVYLDDWQDSALKALKDDTGVTTATRIREALTEYLASHGYSAPGVPARPPTLPQDEQTAASAPIRPHPAPVVPGASSEPDS